MIGQFIIYKLIEAGSSVYNSWIFFSIELFWTTFTTRTCPTLLTFYPLMSLQQSCSCCYLCLRCVCDALFLLILARLRKCSYLIPFFGRGSPQYCSILFGVQPLCKQTFCLQFELQDLLNNISKLRLINDDNIHKSPRCCYYQ